MIKPILALAVAGAALALAACASHPSNQPGQQNAVAKNQKVREVCTSHAPLGSHIAKAQCVTMTEAQYKAYKKAQKENAVQDRASLERMDLGHNKQCGGTTGIAC